MATNTRDYHKLILSYDVNPNQLQAYYQFVMGSYLPTLQKRGIEMLEAWTASYGNVPNRQIGLVARDLDTMVDLLDSETWETLTEQLGEFVSDFDYKLVPFREGFQF